jgi:hypothetical protein
MSLITAHRILIGTAVIFFIVFAAWEIRAYAATGDAWALLRAGVSGVVSVGWALYLRTVKPRGGA